MSAKPSKWIAGITALGALAAAGCGSTNPPCATDLSELESVRTDAQNTEGQLTALRQERDRLDAQIAAEGTKRAELLQRKQELDAKIAELEG